MFENVSSGIKDIYLCKGDKVTLYFYNTTANTWTPRVNSSFFGKSANLTTGVASFTASSLESKKDYQMTVEATGGASGSGTTAPDNPDKLTVMDYAGNVYHYNIHVAAAREIMVGSNVTHECNSVAANNTWSASHDNMNVATVSIPNTTKGQTKTATITGVGVGETTVHVSDYKYSTSTIGALGAAYDLKVKVYKERFDRGSVSLAVGASQQVTDISGVVAVSSTDPMTVAVSREGDNVTITGGSPGTATVDIETATQVYSYKVNVTASAMNITLCVGDVVKFNYDLGDNYAQYQVYGDQCASAAVEGQGSSSGSTQNKYYRSGCLTITALKPTPDGEPTEVTLQIRRLNENYSDYETIKVTVLPARLYEVGDKDDFTSHASSFLSGRGNASWSALSHSPAGIVTAEYQGAQSVTSASVRFTGKANGVTYVTVKNTTADASSNKKGVEYILKIAVIEPHAVTLAKGDNVKIWYHNTTRKSWSLILNGTTYATGVTGEGRGFDAIVKTGYYEDSAAQQSYIDITAKEVAPESDLIIVTDGDNYYAYRMTCDGERIIKVGDTAEVTCRTVSTYSWSAEIIEGSRDFVSASCPEHDSGDTHGSTVTITGLDATDGAYAYVRMHNEWYDPEEINAQGAIYTLACKVIGGPIIQVHLSEGAFIWVQNGYWAGTNATYNVTTNAWSGSDLVDKSQVGFRSYKPDSFTWTWHGADGDHGLAPKLEINANPGATIGDYVVYTVWAGDEKVVTYVVNVTMTFERMIAVGQTAEGFLYGSTEPWVAQSSDPSICEVSQTTYQNLESAKAIPIRAGDVIICCTNPVTKADYWGIKLKPYESYERTIELKMNETLEVTLPTNPYDPALVAPWRIETAATNKVTAVLTSGSEADATSATVRITAGSTVGSDMLVVGNSYYREQINIRVVDPNRKTSVIEEKFLVQAGSTTNLVAEAISGDWTAYVEHPEFLSVTESGSGSVAFVTGIAAGESIVTVVTEDTVYFVTVEVVRRHGDLPMLVLWIDQNGKGQQLSTNLVGLVAAGRKTSVESIRTDDSMIVDVMAAKDNGYLVAAKQEGHTWAHVQTSDSEYLQEVVVKLNHIDKRGIKLVVGRNGTKSVLRENYYQLVSCSNNAPDRIELIQLGNSLQIVPVGSIGEAEVFVECFQADYPDFPVTIHYWIEIRQLQDDEIREYDQGYIAYRGVSDIYEDGSDLVLTFTNVGERAQLRIPEGLTARIDLLAVGGGGAGGSVYGKLGTGGAGGGGAGGYSSVTNKKFQSGTFGITVGQGGSSYDTSVIGQSMAGGIGLDSYLTNSFGYAFILATGGGGGAAPSASDYIGIPGGSGGGGAWSGYTAGNGGKGVDGQGQNGGTPSEDNFKCGAGGGGADGVGGSDQQGGPGLMNAITGENVLYAVGGNGGRHDVVAAGQPGSGVGYGGAGGSCAAGGDGSDGIVVLRFKRLFKNILVPIPTTNDFITTLRTEWTNGVDVVPFPYEERQFRSPTDMELRNWTDAIDHITGSNFVHCCWGDDVTTDEDGNLTTNKVGVGYYALNVYLKDGYAWDDGTQYGSTEYLRFNWVITEDINNVDARVEVSKTIIWEDGSPNAIVRINTSASPEMSGAKTPEVLFIGSLCTSHGFSGNVFESAINSITKQANVDFALYNGVKSVPKGELKPDISGSLLKGETYKAPSTFGKTSNHAALYGFYNSLAAAIDSGKKYDYVVFSFDRGLVATEMAGVHAREAEISAWLKPFYDNNSVIWLIDPTPDSFTKSKTTYTLFPWYPCQLIYFNYGAGSSQNKWSSLRDWYSNVGKGGTGMTDYAQMNALMGVFDPNHYPVNETTYSDNRIDGNSTITADKVANVSGDPCEYQVGYDNAAAVADLLSSVIKVKPFDISFKDKIMSPASGLTITGVTVNGCSTPDPDDKTKPSEDSKDWKPIIEWTPAGLDTATADGYYGSITTYSENFGALGIEDAVMTVSTNNEVFIDISNCTAQVWTRFDTHVHDDGTFCTSENAEYNQQTGKFEKNPNDGPATVGVIMGGGGQGMDINGDAETSIPWRYTAYEIRGHVNGNVGGEIYVGGTRSQTESFREHTDVHVYYRAKGGYRLTALRVDKTDHNSVDELTEHATSWTFSDIIDEHDVYVTFSSFFGDTESSPAEYVYDGAVHVYPVELIGWENIYSNEVRYATSPTAEDDEWLSAEDFCASNRADRSQTCVGEHTYYYRVFAFQPGYGDTFDESGWVWVDTGVNGCDTVTITKAPLVITANSFLVGSTDAPVPTGAGDVGYTFTEEDAVWRGVVVSGLAQHVDENGNLVDDTVITNGTIVIECPEYRNTIGQYLLTPTNAPGKLDSDIDPSGNYAIEFRPGAISVIKSPMKIGGVLQFGELNPDDPLVDTGVPRVEKTYDGAATNLVMDVQTPSDPSDFHIQYSTDGANWSDTNPQFTHAGTYKVWYSVTSGASYDESDYFYVTNYNYVVISPAEIELTSESATKTYDGNALAYDHVKLTGGELFSGDTFGFETTGSQTDVGSSDNTFTYTITSGDGTDHGADDYKVSIKNGTLTVTPARIVINGTEHPDTPDPTKARDYGDTGVQDVTAIYDGTGWNITVKVDAPVKDAVVKFSTNKNDAASWSSSLEFTDVGEYVVYFSVDAPNYASVTNFARVTINPAQATVTADDKFILEGDAVPEYTATVSGLVLRDAGKTDLITYPSPSSAYVTGSTDGEYPIVFAGKTAPERQGNYVVTFVPGTLYVDKTARVGSLWITDHRSLGVGTNAVALAFKPTLSSGELTAEAVRELAAANKILVARAYDEEALKSAVPKPVELLDAENLPDLDKGWIWVKVPVDLYEMANGESVFKSGVPMIWKISILR